MKYIIHNNNNFNLILLSYINAHIVYRLQKFNIGSMKLVCDCLITLNIKLYARTFDV